MTALLPWLFALELHARPRVVVGVRAPLTSVSDFAPLTIEGYRVTSLAREPLARLDVKTGELEPWLATAWRRTRDGLAVTLRAGVATHAGRTLAARDVVDTLNAFREPKNHAATWLPLWQKVVGARVTGPLAVEFTGDLDYADVVALLTTLRVRPATGPFELGDVREGRVDLRPRPGWWHGATPEFDLTFKPVADETLARQLVAKGELDLYADVDGAGTRVTGAGGLWLDLNLRRPPFDEPEVRRALLLLWDRAGVNRRVFGGDWRVAIDTFDPRTPAYPPGKPEPYDPASARAALKRAGYRAVDGRWTKGDRALTFEVLVTSARDERWVGLLQADLAKYGVGLGITRVPADASLFARLREGRFDACAGGGGLSVHVDAAAWRADGAYNVAGFSDQGVDRDLAALAREFSPGRRRVLERTLIEKLRAARAALPGLVRDFAVYLTSPKLKISVDAPDDVWRWRKED